ncbi:hypothetical protein ILUMI_05724 [Ignelater luminosus]|uniref:Uncharacterized protein n=1 Tax=Ignelater luminosus TaxID=2038154 RepID=A0A8K0DCG7_IGNLU|nr:hypothetical protein ILUMI_05724 [Ignelater luminosus]
MPEGCQSITTAIDVIFSAEETKVTIDFVKGKLLLEEPKQLKSRQEQEVTNNAAFAGYKRQRKKNLNNRNKIEDQTNERHRYEDDENLNENGEEHQNIDKENQNEDGDENQDGKEEGKVEKKATRKTPREERKKYLNDFETSMMTALSVGNLISDVLQSYEEAEKEARAQLPEREAGKWKDSKENSPGGCGFPTIQSRGGHLHSGGTYGNVKSIIKFIY